MPILYNFLIKSNYCKSETLNILYQIIIFFNLKIIISFKGMKPSSEDKALIAGSWSCSLQVRTMFCWARQEWTGQTFIVHRLFYFTANDSVLQPFGKLLASLFLIHFFSWGINLNFFHRWQPDAYEAVFPHYRFFLSQRWSQFSYFMFTILQWDVFFHYCNCEAEALGLKLSMLQFHWLNHSGCQHICAVWC